MAEKLPFGEGVSINRPPLFCGLNYQFWKVRMKIFVELNGPFIPMFEKDDVFFEKPWSQWSESESKRAQYDCIAKNIITPSLNSNKFFRVSKCGSAKEMWDTLEVTHEGTDEIKRARRRSQARRKIKQNKKEANLCWMAKEEDDASSVSSCTSLNAKNYSQLLQAFKETHEETNRLTFLNNRLKGLNNWLENKVKALKEELENSKTDFENLEMIYKNSS